jgi:hypothetical protein
LLKKVSGTATMTADGIRYAKRKGCGTIHLTASNEGVKLYTAMGFEHNGNFMQMKL